MSIPQKISYVILVPHRDSLNYPVQIRDRLFSNNVLGAHSFPLCAPLIRISSSFTQEEMKELSLNIRNKYEKLLWVPPAFTRGLNEKEDNLFFFGLGLDINIVDEDIPETARIKSLDLIKPVTICSAISYSMDEVIKLKNLLTETGQDFSSTFRSAYLANLHIYLIEPAYSFKAYSFKWKIGSAVWLPGKAFRKDKLKEQP